MNKMFRQEKTTVNHAVDVLYETKSALLKKTHNMIQCLCHDGNMPALKN